MKRVSGAKLIVLESTGCMLEETSNLRGMVYLECGGNTYTLTGIPTFSILAQCRKANRSITERIFARSRIVFVLSTYMRGLNKRMLGIGSPQGVERMDGERDDIIIECRDNTK